jgi:hypothetical protein
MISISIDAVSPHALLLAQDDFMWTAYTVSSADLAAAATSNSITLASLPAKTVLHAVVIKHSAAFTGGTITLYTLSVGIAGTTDKYASAFNVLQAPGNSIGQLSGSLFCENFAAPTTVQITAASTGGLLNTATTGSATIYLCTTTLP